MRTENRFDPVFDCQQVFKALMNALAQPGKVFSIQENVKRLGGDDAPFRAVEMCIRDSQKDLPQELKDKVKEFLLSYDDPEYFGDEEGKEPQRFVEISDSDYDYLADLKETYNLSD